ncbi:MAG: hypothetical protein EB114_13830 [Betaproteobacteria bacterium]|nr:hypothetical protein [Betaproteobacteria bacterium]
MFLVNPIDPIDNLSVSQSIDKSYLQDPRAVDFFDKDGYELTQLEQHYYRAQGLVVSRYTADHPGLFQPWITVNHEYLSIDHSCAMYRCDFTGAARDQLLEYRSQNSRLGWLLTSRQKWGLDLNIDYCDQNIALEVIHLEWDSYDAATAEEQRVQAEQLVLNTDWIDAAYKIWDRRDQWQNLTGWYAQAHWKAKYFGLARPWY